jgi:DNA-binding SARP family transcriptional activator
MKKLLTILKLINNWTNHQISAEEEAHQILKFLLLKNDTKRVIEVYEALEKAIESEMDNRAFEALRNARLIQGKWGVKSIVKDPVFDKPINEIKVVYEKIN